MTRSASEDAVPSSSYSSEPPMANVAWLRPALYGALNIAAATGIVFANKAVLSIYGFEFTTALTLLHTLTTIAGMTLFCQLGFFSPKTVSKIQVSAKALATVFMAGTTQQSTFLGCCQLVSLLAGSPISSGICWICSVE